LRYSTDILKSAKGIDLLLRVIIFTSKGKKDEVGRCQGASEAIRRRATLDTADGGKAEWKKRE